MGWDRYLGFDRTGQIRSIGPGREEYIIIRNRFDGSFLGEIGIESVIDMVSLVWLLKGLVWQISAIFITTYYNIYIILKIFLDKMELFVILSSSRE